MESDGEVSGDGSRVTCDDASVGSMVPTMTTASPTSAYSTGHDGSSPAIGF